VALVELKTSLTFAPDGTANGATLLLRDITEQRVAEEARIKSEALEVENRQIQETSRVKSLFLANMSHELRTPLNSIIGFAELLETGVVPPDSPRYHHFLGNISRSGAHLLRLINDVLDLSKVDAGKLSFSPQPVQLDRTVDDVVTSMGTDIAAKSLRVTQSVDAGIGVVMIDEGRFRQVLYNYLSNAVKFTPAGGDISLRATLEGPDHFRLEVQDSGAGIEPKDLERLFVEFQQLDSSFTRQHQGTGLGLALTRKLVEAQGGSVGVRSTVGQGSVFHLVLPRQTQAINVD
jgi:signal transduction histidine kinase